MIIDNPNSSPKNSAAIRLRAITFLRFGSSDHFFIVVLD